MPTFWPGGIERLNWWPLEAALYTHPIRSPATVTLLSPYPETKKTPATTPAATASATTKAATSFHFRGMCIVRTSHALRLQPMR